jgi:hypothetical protein
VGMPRPTLLPFFSPLRLVAPGRPPIDRTTPAASSHQQLRWCLRGCWRWCSKPAPLRRQWRQWREQEV